MPTITRYDNGNLRSLRTAMKAALVGVEAEFGLTFDLNAAIRYDRDGPNARFQCRMMLVNPAPATTATLPMPSGAPLELAGPANRADVGTFRPPYRQVPKRRHGYVPMIDDRNCSYMTESKARGVAASCQRDDEGGWTYTAVPAGGDAPIENPAHTQWFYVEVRDETGALLGNL